VITLNGRLPRRPLEGIMKLGKFKRSTDQIAEAELSDEEFDFFHKYALKNCPKKAQDEFLINWAIVDILKKQIKKQTKKRS
jgi:hypothetical protein